MTNPKIAPFGAWKSPITSDLIVAESIRLGGGLFDNDDIYWLEGRPSEGGRNVLVRRTPDGQTSDITPAPFNPRTRVHEYGGRSIIVNNGFVTFSNFADQRLYRVQAGGTPQAMTPEVALRYADGIIDAARHRIICVREDHTQAGEAINTITALDLDDGAVQTILVSGNDFYASPRLSPKGDALAWLTWNHPNMPWDGTELWIANVQTDGTLTNVQCITGSTNESIFQPQWSPDGILYFASDRSGWWNLYRWIDGHSECIIEMDAEFGKSQWVFGMSTYGFASASRIICAYSKDGIDYLASIDTVTKTLTNIDNPYTAISQIQVVPGRVLFLGASATQSTELVLLNLKNMQCTALKKSNPLIIDPGYISTPQPIKFPTENGLIAHALFYPPKNQNYTAPEGDKPPLVVFSHGGPTGATNSALSLSIQFWTSRGFAILDVNYGGSTGYGRAYRERLNGQWGIVDVDDCANGALYLVNQGLADSERLAIRGGSAGGYTTLCALTFRDTFKVGASYFGVGDLEALALETHKFESRYLDGLISPYPEQRKVYLERSPIHHVERLNCPVIFFQGLEDKVVPPGQAEAMVKALREKGIPVAYVPFEGEQHGFRRAENIKRSLDAELYFYARIFNFDLAESINPVIIENLPSNLDPQSLS